MHCDLYAYAVGRIAGDVVPDTSNEFARCAVCGMFGSCDDVRVVSFAEWPDSGYVANDWRVCDSCQYAAVYGCSCQDCGFCRAVDVPLFQHSNGVIEAGRRDTEGVN